MCTKIRAAVGDDDNHNDDDHDENDDDHDEDDDDDDSLKLRLNSEAQLYGVVPATRHETESNRQRRKTER